MYQVVQATRRVLRLAILLTTLVGAPLVGQRPVWTVGGQSPNFTDLPQAVAAAAPGSVLRVRPGTYTGFVTNKPLRILLDFTATTGSVVPPAGSAYAIEVNGLPAGETFALVGRGARVTSGTLGAVRVANCGGHVVLTAITVAAGNTTSGVDAQNAACVLVERSAVTGTPALQAQDAVVVSTAVDWSSPGGRGIVALRGSLELTLGSSGGRRMPALHVTDGFVRLAGNGATALAVGGAPPGPVAAFEAIRSVVQWQASRFVLTPANGSPGFVQVASQTVVDDVPSLVATGAAPGASMSLNLTRSTPAPGVVVLGNLVVPHQALGLTGLYWDEQQPAVVLAAGVADAPGLQMQINWPNVTWLLGELFCSQGVVITPSGSLLRSGPAMWVCL